MAMRVRQYAYFGIYSQTVPPEMISRAVGALPDESRTADDFASPEKKPNHAWVVQCDARGAAVDDQLAVLYQRLAPHRAAILGLVLDGSVFTKLAIVRYLDDPDGEADPNWYQHRMLGWHIPVEMIQFLADTRAFLDVDEYGAGNAWERAVDSVRAFLYRTRSRMNKSDSARGE